MVLLTFTEYEVIRSEGKHTATKPGDGDPSIERVLEVTDRYVLTEKVGDAARAIDDADPE